MKEKGSMTAAEAGRIGGQRRATSGGMTVAEAGRKGGRKVAAERGHAFYEEIGHKGGQRVREMMEKARQYDELADLGLLPTQERIEAAKQRAAK